MTATPRKTPRKATAKPEIPVFEEAPDAGRGEAGHAAEPSATAVTVSTPPASTQSDEDPQDTCESYDAFVTRTAAQRGVSEQEIRAEIMLARQHATPPEPSATASPESDETGHRSGPFDAVTRLERTSEGTRWVEGHGVSGQPAEYGERRESPAPGSERHAEIVAQAPDGPVPVYQGQFAVYEDPDDPGGYVLSVRLDDGTEQVKRIPSALVLLASGGGGLLGRLTGLGKLFG